MLGNSNDDILIAGLTTKDAHASALRHEAFWCSVLEEWNHADSFTSRVNNLQGGTRATATSCCPKWWTISVPTRSISLTAVRAMTG